MVLEHLDESLPDNSGSAEDSDWDFLRHLREEKSSYITFDQEAEITNRLPLAVVASGQMQSRDDLRSDLFGGLPLGMHGQLRLAVGRQALGI